MNSQRWVYPCLSGLRRRRQRGEEISQDTRQHVALEVRVEEARAQPLLSAQVTSAGRHLIGTANPALRRPVARDQSSISDCAWLEGVSVIGTKVRAHSDSNQNPDQLIVSCSRLELLRRPPWATEGVCGSKRELGRHRRQGRG